MKIAGAADSASSKVFQDRIVIGITTPATKQELSLVGHEVNPGSLALATLCEWFGHDAS